MEDTLFKLPPTLKVGGKDYKAIDLQNEWSFRQKKIARELLEGLFSTKDVEFSEDTSMKGIEITGLSLHNIANLDLEPKILALIYIESDEKMFTKETYDARCKAFEDVMMTEEVEGAIELFFDSKAPLIMKGIQTYYQSVGVKA